MARADEPQWQQLEKDLTGWDDPPGRLMRALERNDLELFAQPIVELVAPPRLAMAEVLVRLREEEEALLPPGMFLPVFEYCGMMHELDRWIARQAIARLARGAALPRLSINISAQTLGDAEFVPEIARELARAALPPSALAFEIGEADLILRPATAKQFAAAARAAGMELVLESFGRTAAAFQPLRALQASFVKVDGVIVRALHSSQIARNKLEAIVRIGEATGVRLIGECVETREALEALRASGVRYAQGFGIAAPAPLDSLAAAAAPALA
jgi:EAL domain-containing protein (putative c-di-GMP-specific phosphodiesterase class I)